MILDNISQIITDTKLTNPNNYLPNSYKLLNSEHTKLFDRKLIQDHNELNYYKSKIKNLDLDVFIINDPSPNAFTIPGIDNISLLKSDPVEYQSLGLNVLLRHPLSANLNNQNQIIFNSSIKNFKILVFIHSGLMKKIKNIDDRFAVILHEIGHWVHIKNLLNGSDYLNILLSYLINPLHYSLILTTHFNITQHFYFLINFLIRTVLITIINIKNRQNEYDADSFVKQVGYSKNLQNALSLLDYEKDLKKVSIEDKDSWLINFLDIVSMLFIDHSHPPTHKRILSLQESLELNLFDKFMDLLKSIDTIIKANNGTLCYFK